MFENWEDANQKLSNTVILHNKDAVYVLQALPADPLNGKGMLLEYYNLPYNRRNKQVAELSDGFDWKNLGDYLGYFNWGHEKHGYRESIFIQRQPVRKSIQGLSVQNLRLSGLNQVRSAGLPAIGQPKFDSLITEDKFCSNFRREFPKLPDIRALFTKHPSSVSYAFHPLFAVKRNEVGPFYLVYREKAIAWSDDVDRFTLDWNYSFLQETLEFNNIAFKRASTK